MKFYTVQNAEIIKDLMQNKVLTSDWKYSPPEFLKAYKWMAKQLKTRRPNLKNPSKSLIWLFDKIPNQYTLEHFNEPGTQVILEVDLPESQVLASNFDAWDLILLDCPLLTDDEYSALPEEQRDRLLDKPISTWGKVFDLETARRIADPNLECVEKIQYVTGEISLSNIKVHSFYKIYKTKDEDDEQE